MRHVTYLSLLPASGSLLGRFEPGFGMWQDSRFLRFLDSQNPEASILVPRLFPFSERKVLGKRLLVTLYVLVLTNQ